MAQEEITQGPSTLDLMFSLTKGFEITFDTRVGVNVSYASSPEVRSNVGERKVVATIDSMEVADITREKWNLRGRVVTPEDVIGKSFSGYYDSRTRKGDLYIREA